MGNINMLVQEDLSKSDSSFYDSREDYKNKKSQRFKSRANPYSRVDGEKVDDASSTTGMSRGITSNIQKFSGDIGGIDKALNKPSIDNDVTEKEALIIKQKAAQQFNRIMGEKIL